MLDEPTAYLVALVALLVGSAAGFLFHWVAASVLHGETWPDVPRWRKRMLGWTGVIAAFLAGTIALATAESFQPQELLARMWAYQTGAGWLGPVFLDWISEKRKGGKG